MKIARTDSEGKITIFPSLSKAADDAGLDRRKFSRQLKSNKRISVWQGPGIIPIVYTIPTELKTKRR